MPGDTLTGRPARSPQTLLLVEDNAIIGLSEAKTLAEAGYHVVHALSGDDAVAHALHPDSPIDLVLMDVDLGKGMDGTEAARAILQSRDVPVVFLSSHTETELLERAEGITNYGYVLKSAGATVLLASIRMAFKLHDSYLSLKRKDEALQRSEERYQKAFMASPLAIILSRVRDAVVIDVNDAFTRLLGYGREEVIGRTTVEAGLWESPADRDVMLARLSSKGRLEDYEVRYRRADGRHMEGLAAFDYLEIEGERCLISITQDVTEARERERALREKEAHYGVLFNDVSNAVIEEDFSEVKRYLEGLRARGIEDLDAWLSSHLEEVRACSSTVRIVDFNQEYMRILNVPDRSRVVRTIQTIVPDEALLMLKDEFLALWRGDRTFAIATPNFIEGSPVRHLQIRVSLVSGHEEDWSSVLVSLTDITREVESGAALQTLVARQEILMRELEHRVKNNLNIVSSLLSLESGKLESDADREVFMAAQSRIRSISLIYDLLSRAAPGDRLSCASYFRDLALLLKETFAPGRHDISLGLEIPDIDIDVKRGVSLGLLTNELLTNSFKYAFPGRGGTILFSMRESGDRLELVVGDDGVGAPEGFDREGDSSLGMRLVDMLVQQLRGTLEVRTRPGFRTAVSIPLEA